MKKIILLILSILMLSGCTVNYNLVYENETFKENLEVTSQKDKIIDGQVFSSIVDNYYNNVNVLVDYKVQPGDMTDEEILLEYDTYNKTLINREDVYGINLGYDYNEETNYVNSSLVYSLFDKIEITDDYINVSGGKNIFDNYSNLEQIVVSFKTDKKVLEANSDEVKNNTYYWYINKINYDKKTIKINIDKSVVIEEFNENVNNITRIVFILLGVVLFIGLIFVLIKFKNSNKK